MIYADIIIDISSDKLDRSFQYRVPERLEKKIKAGMVAAIPFGNAGRVRKGYVIGLSDEPKIAPEKIKEISEICSGEKILIGDYPQLELSSTKKEQILILHDPCESVGNLIQSGANINSGRGTGGSFIKSFFLQVVCVMPVESNII